VTSLARAACLLAAGLAAGCGAAAESTGVGRRLDIALPRETDTVESRVPSRATLAGLLVANHLSADLAAEVVAAVHDVFDPRTLRTDRPFTLTRGLDGSFRAFQYAIDADRLLRVVMRPGVAAAQPLFDVSVVTTPKTIERRVIDANISRDHPSLIGSLDAEGENVELALRLADVLGGEVDFNSDLQPGDRISALFDRVVRNKIAGEYGDINAAILQNAGRHIVAIRFDTSEGKPAWYDEDGRSLKRRFLKSPLPFEPRITSGFSMSRMHPIFGYERPHLGVDYGAPAGTSVVAVAAGVIESAGWNGEAGQMVAIRHSGGYETLYLHLSAFAPGIHPGVHVDQGTLIGRVGMTGAATAPHLDYRIKKSGTYVNPVLELQRMPKGEPIDASALPAFRETRDRLLQELSSRIAERPAHAASPAAAAAPARPAVSAPAAKPGSKKTPSASSRKDRK
jgi:murein DD-endopeptidase MepM/ murein hydrolase activator NlpD